MEVHKLRDIKDEFPSFLASTVGVEPVFPPAAANCSWQVSSLSETKAHQVMQQKATSFIQFNQQQLSRIYPSSYRVDSSNFNPQPFWNAGCQLGEEEEQGEEEEEGADINQILTRNYLLLFSVALNYQSEGRVLQLNRAKFYSNGNCGYILKPDCMCQGRHRKHSLGSLSSVQSTLHRIFSV